MTTKSRRSRSQVLAAMLEAEAAAKAAAAATRIGPHQLSKLEYEIYLLIELRPRPADLVEILAANLPGDAQEAADPDAPRLPAASRIEIERAVGALERQGYIEKITRAEAGELFRLTPWGKAALKSARHEHRWDLQKWERRGHRRGESRPELTAAVVELSPCEIGPTFDDLDLDYLGLPSRVRSPFHYQGIETVGQLAGMTAEKLLHMRNIGPKAVAAIEARLRAVALELAPQEASPTGGDAAAAVGDKEEKMRPEWEGKPYLYKVFTRTGRLSEDNCTDWDKERVLWTKPLIQLANALDELPSFGRGVPEEARPLKLAFDTLLVLVEAGWWREHSPRESTNAETQRLIALLGHHEPVENEGTRFLRAIESGPEATWQLLENVVTAAAETFVRARDPEGLWRCARLMRVVLWES